MRVTCRNIMLSLAAMSLATGVLAQTKPGGATMVEGGNGPLPPGPHFILTVPIVLRSIPPEVNQYEVGCVVFGTDAGVIMGNGLFTGPITAVDVKGTGVFSTEATVDVFLRDPTGAAFAEVRTYRCQLFLNGTAGGHSQRYFGEKSSSVQMPVSPGAPLQRAVGGPIPP